jgi:DNA-binding beta-propeller fold protein YncE
VRILALLLLSVAAWSGTLHYVGAWPDRVLMFDEDQKAITGEVKLKTGVARAMMPTHDKKKIIVLTMQHSGIETIDLATKQVVDSFQLGDAGHKVRVTGFVLDPTDRYIYVVFTEAFKRIDHYEMLPPRFGVIDLQEKKIVRTAEIPKDEALGFRGQFAISPDGRYLYAFRENILIFDTTTFKIVDRIELAKPQWPGMETIFMGLAENPHDPPGVVTTMFNSTDPAVHRDNFGIARVNLVNRTVDFQPVGPSTTQMTGLQATPDGKTGYTVAIYGTHGNRRTEFMKFDLSSNKLTARKEFAGRTRFTVGMSSTGKELYIYGAGNTIEVYDAHTLNLVKDIDVNADMTTSLVTVLPNTR